MKWRNYSSDCTRWAKRYPSFYVVEGDRDFFGREKPYELEAILNSGQLDAWKDKITYHKAKIPMGVKGYDVQTTQSRAMRSQMRDYDPRAERHPFGRGFG